MCDAVGPGFDITRFYEKQCQPSSGSAWPASPKKMVNRAPLLGRKILTPFAQWFVSAVTAPPLVGCVVWSPKWVCDLYPNIYCNEWLTLYIISLIDNLSKRHCSFKSMSAVIYSFPAEDRFLNDMNTEKAFNAFPTSFHYYAHNNRSVIILFLVLTWNMYDVKAVAVTIMFTRYETGEYQMLGTMNFTNAL